MLSRIVIVFLLAASLNIAQEGYKPWVKAERERHARTIQLSKIQYPGDTKIDVTYYGLDLNITYQPNYIAGKVIVNALVDTSSITGFFLDLSDSLTVDSVLSDGSQLNFTHSDNKINIALDGTYLQKFSY